MPHEVVPKPPVRVASSASWCWNEPWVDRRKSWREKLICYFEMSEATEVVQSLIYRLNQTAFAWNNKIYWKRIRVFISICGVYFRMLPCELATGIPTRTRIETQRPVGEKMRECRVLCLQGIGLVNLTRKYLLATESTTGALIVLSTAVPYFSVESACLLDYY